MSSMTADAMDVLLHSNNLINQIKSFRKEQKMENKLGPAIEKISMARPNNGGDGMATIPKNNYGPEEREVIETMATKNKITINWIGGNK